MFTPIKFILQVFYACFAMYATLILFVLSLVVVTSRL